jgi:phenylalanyl-tRNA synthetase beta chain
MNVSHDWLRDFVPHALDPGALGALLSRHVATLDGVTPRRADLAPFVVAQVVRSERVPDTKLSFNQVDDGSGALLDVVCGAPNVAVGARYPFARVGTVMPGGVTIERRKIRGFSSHGMLCSARELGLGEEHDGILTLATDAPPGTPLLQVLRVGDVVLDLDVLANRPDLLCIRGVAREVVALTGIALRDPGAAVTAADPAAGALLAQVPLPALTRGEHAVEGGGVRVTIDDAAGCPAYGAAVIRGVRVGPSPAWLRDRLEAVGARSINAVVDVTNYCLWALGQPMHAFDLGRLGGPAIVVRRAHAGEPLTTLDGVARTLTPEHLVIADVERATAVAGVMGGRESEVTDATTDVLLEVARFDPRQVRRDRRALGLSTDASYRFERGTDPATTADLLGFAAGLIAALAGGRVEALLHAAPGDAPARAAVRLTEARVTRLLGQAVDAPTVERLLAAIGFGVVGDGPGAWSVTPPSWRHDVSRDVDLIEDIARLVGYDTFPDDLRPGRPSAVPDHPLWTGALRVRDALVADGYFELKPLPFVAGGDETHARVANPLAEDEPHLRRTLLESLARRVEHNWRFKQRDLRLFEVGHAYAPRAGDVPAETVHVAAVLTGARAPRHFADGAPAEVDAWDAKALGERIARVAFPGAHVTMDGTAPDAEAGVLWRIAVGGTPCGEVRALADLDRPGWARELAVFGVEVRLGAIASAPVAAPGAHTWGGAASAAPPRHVQYTPLPVMEAATFDLALVVPACVSAAAVEARLREVGGDLLESVEVFDEYRGAEVGAGHRSLAWRLTFRHPERTLRDKEIEGRRAKLLAALKEIDVEPRGA